MIQIRLVLKINSLPMHRAVAMQRLTGGGRSHQQYCLSIPLCLQGNLQGILRESPLISSKTNSKPWSRLTIARIE